MQSDFPKQLEARELLRAMAAFPGIEIRRSGDGIDRSWPIAEVTPPAVATAKIVELLQCSE